MFSPTSCKSSCFFKTSFRASSFISTEGSSWFPQYRSVWLLVFFLCNPTTWGKSVGFPSSTNSLGQESCAQWIPTCRGHLHSQLSGRGTPATGPGWAVQQRQTAQAGFENCPSWCLMIGKECESFRQWPGLKDICRDLNNTSFKLKSSKGRGDAWQYVSLPIQIWQEQHRTPPRSVYQAVADGIAKYSSPRKPSWGTAVQGLVLVDHLRSSAAQCLRMMVISIIKLLTVPVLCGWLTWALQWCVEVSSTLFRPPDSHKSWKTLKKQPANLSQKKNQVENQEMSVENQTWEL